VSDDSLLKLFILAHAVYNLKLLQVFLLLLICQQRLGTLFGQHLSHLSFDLLNFFSNRRFFFGELFTFLIRVGEVFMVIE